MLKADLHIHTRLSNSTQSNRWPKWLADKIIDSRSTIDEILQSCVQKDIKIISITDHDEIAASFEAIEKAKKYNILVLPGIEITSKDGHILAYGVKKIIPPKLSIEETISLIHKDGGIAVAAHPFSPMGIFFMKKVKKYDLDAMEVYDSFASRLSEKAVDYSHKYNIPMVAGSDAHTPALIGNTYTLFDCPQEYNFILASIKEGKTTIEITGGYNLLTTALEVIRYNYLRI